MNKNSVDVVCITETWLSTKISDSAVAMNNFVLFRNDCPSHAGGVGIYVNCKIPCKRLPDYQPSESIAGTLWTQLRPVRLPRKISVILLGIVYHPPRANAADNNHLYNHVQSAVDTLLRTHPDYLIWIVGDFNPEPPISRIAILNMRLYLRKLSRFSHAKQAY